MTFSRTKYQKVIMHKTRIDWVLFCQKCAMMRFKCNFTQRWTLLQRHFWKELAEANFYERGIKNHVVKKLQKKLQNIDQNIGRCFWIFAFRFPRDPQSSPEFTWVPHSSLEFPRVPLNFLLILRINSVDLIKLLHRA